MKRLLKIEWLKSWPSRYFRVMMGIWVFAFLALPIGFNLLLAFLENQGFSLDQLPGISATDLPIFDFVDLWQNLAYVYKGISIFFAILVIINITNELDYKTFRQNVIDGMSKTEFLISKLLLMFGLATFATIMVFLMGIIVGFSASSIITFDALTAHINFLGAYWLHIVLLLSFCMLLSILIKRAGLVIAILLFWMFILEPIAGSVLQFGLKQDFLAAILPLESIWNLVPRPLEKYGLRETVYWVSTQSVVIAFTQLGMYLTAIWLLLVKRDIK